MHSLLLYILTFHEFAVLFENNSEFKSEFCRKRAKEALHRGHLKLSKTLENFKEKKSTEHFQITAQHIDFFIFEV